MIQRIGAPPETPGGPWDDPAPTEGLAFAVLWTTGPDPRRDGLFRLAAVRRRPNGSWERLERTCDPFAGGGTEGPGADDQARAAATARMAREYGVTGGDLETDTSPAEAIAELVAFLGQAPVLVPDRVAFAGWVARAGGTGEVPGRLVGIGELESLLAPGRRGERTTSDPRAPLAVEPEHLHARLADLARGVLAHRDPQLAVLAHGLRGAWGALVRGDDASADDVALALTLIEHPDVWCRGPDRALFADVDLPAGRLTDAVSAHPDLLDALDEARPAWGRTAKEEQRREPMPTVADEAITLDEADRRLVDEIFQEHLPRLFAERFGGDPSYREGQHAVAAEIAAGQGARELLLVHAPTGTGKTLAYLVPTMLWALRNSVRVGVATYTRALQEQALDREVPLALELLERGGVAGVADKLVVSLLKGRDNYLCWRALRLQSPIPADRATDHLAWSTLAVFALSDADGDLDRFPQRPPLELGDPDAWGKSIRKLLRLARAESGCCSFGRDREDCAGHASRRRAQRSHVVITNHALALMRRDLFKHMVFDECEHLHGQARAAFSHEVPFRAVRDLLLRLYKPGGASRHPINRLRAVAEPGGEAARSLDDCVDAQEEALSALDELQRAVFRFKLWREDVRGQRDERDLHSAFREYVLEHDSADLLGAHLALSRSLGRLSIALSALAEQLDTLPSRGILRIRRTLDLLRIDLEEVEAGVLAWIPRDDHGPAFRAETFHDLETTPGGHDVMVARVLLPHEHLGRRYYPELHGAVLISATTWLRGGFEAASHYLGCHRAAHPDENEERSPVELRTFRAPEVFDYSRVLVAAPRDAPAVNTNKKAFLRYVARFVAFLGERTRGRTLVLFTNAEDCIGVGREVEPFFAERRIPLWYQRMEGTAKEELSELFRTQVDSVLLGLETFWYGADFPGETLQYLVLVRLPYGVPDRYHHAQCAALGPSEQRNRIYMPRALARFRQGFGRLMRKESDRGCVFLLDGRILDPRHRSFLRELPLNAALDPREPAVELPGVASLVRGDTDRCMHAALSHMEMLTDVRRRGLDTGFAGWTLDGGSAQAGSVGEGESIYEIEPPPRVPEEDIPF